MTETSEKYLAMMLEGYENNHQNLTMQITTMEEQLSGAREACCDMETSMEELKELLGLEEEVVEEEEPQEEAQEA